MTAHPDFLHHHPRYPPSRSNSANSFHGHSQPNHFISHPSNSNSNSLNHLHSNHSSSSLRYKELNTAFGPISLNRLMRKEWIKYYLILLLIAIVLGLVSIYHHQIVIWLHPYVEDLRKLKINGYEVGWLIPIAVLFIISFPPLFGHEIVIILCGLVWGLWFGFAIVSAGTLLGELGNYWTFKHACAHRAAALEKKDPNYACMCIVVREGGFWIAFLARLSAIPGHLVTPVFATTGMSLFVFTCAAVLSMPKQLSGVYLGTLFATERAGQPKSTISRVIQYSVLALSFLVTILAALYIYRKMALVRLQLDNPPESDPGTVRPVDDYYYGTTAPPSRPRYPRTRTELGADDQQSLIAHPAPIAVVERFSTVETERRGVGATTNRRDQSPYSNEDDDEAGCGTAAGGSGDGELYYQQQHQPYAHQNQSHQHQDHYHHHQHHRQQQQQQSQWQEQELDDQLDSPLDHPQQHVYHYQIGSRQQILERRGG